MLLGHHSGRDLTVRPGYFDDLYAASDDPWGLARGFYERRKLALLMAALPRERFERAFEPGCALGLVTRQLAERCDEVLAMDVVPRAVELTRQHAADFPGVTVCEGSLPDDLPPGTFDLVVLSEVGYYVADLDALRSAVHGLLRRDAVVVACHWRHSAPDYPQSADVVHAALGVGMYRLARHVEDDFLMDVWTTVPGSVAQREGIVD
ncbi:MAG TPA: SAM-dependent methyltransferase [Jatrophihabitantaceae bacterium]